MDTKLIGEWGTEILSYRLRTARQKKRMQYKDFHKQLMALGREKNILYRQKRSLGFEPLDPPIQKGWKRIFVLREDVARSKHAEFYAGILAKINTTQWSDRREFIKKKRIFGRKKYVAREQYLLNPDDEQFRKLKFSEAEQMQFHQEWTYCLVYKRFFKYYVFNEPWRFVLKVKPNMIDKIRRIDPEIESRLREIDTHFERTGLRNVLSRLQGRNNRWWSSSEQKDINILKCKPLPMILDALKEERF